MFLKFFGNIIGCSGPALSINRERGIILQEVEYMQHLVDKGNKVASLYDQKTVIRASLESTIQTSKHSKSAIHGRFNNRSVIRRFCKIYESV